MNESLKPKTYVVSLDDSRLNRGVFFCKHIVRHSGSSTDSITETKKMLIVK